MADLELLLAGLSAEQQQGLRALFTSMQASAAAAVTQREVDADNRDLARTLHTILKPQRPPTYSGAIDADAALNFLDNQKEYFMVVKLDRTDWVQYTALALVDDAKSWWRASGLTLSTPWDIFENAFLTFHTPPNSVSAARAALESLKQGKRSVALYTHEFRRLRRRVVSLDDDTALHWFVKGLEPQTGKEVKLRQPESLDQAIMQATLIHSILFPDGPTPHSTLYAAKNDASPMDVDNLHIAINNLTTQVNQLSRSNNGAYNSQNNVNYNANGRARPSKMTPEEKSYLMRNGGCFRCRKLGHMGDQCRTFPNAPQQTRRQINNVETDENQPSQTSHDDLSGKDKGK